MISAVQPVKVFSRVWNCSFCHCTLMVWNRFVFRTPVRERQPSWASYGPDCRTMTGLNITMYVPSLSKAMMRLQTPIMLAAMPTQLSLWAVRVSSRSWAVARSSAVAGAAFWARNVSSLQISRIILCSSRKLFLYCISQRKNAQVLSLARFLRGNQSHMPVCITLPMFHR